MLRNIKYWIYLLFLSAPFLALAQFAAPNTDANSLDTSYLSSLWSNFLFWVLGGLALLSFLGIFIAIIDIMIATSDEDRIKRGKRTLVFSIIGLIVSIVLIIILYYTNLYLGG